MKQTDDNRFNLIERFWFLRRPARLALDLLVLSSAFWFAYLLRFDFEIPVYYQENALDQLPFVVLVEFTALVLVGGYGLIWRYIGLADTKYFLRAAICAALVLLLGRLLLPASFERWQVPLSVAVMSAIFGFGGVFALRMARRSIYDVYEKREFTAARRFAKRQSALLVGAGRTGALTIKEILRGADAGLEVKGLIDDDPQKLGGSVNGVKVLGTIKDLPRLIDEMKINQVILALDNSQGKTIRRITEILGETKVKTRIVPSLGEIVGGRVQLNRIRDVSIEDLLGREAVTLDTDALHQFLSGKTVMVTGAGGSIGAELVRQVCEFKPARILLVERAEFNLFEIDRELRHAIAAQTFAQVEQIALIADICDEARMLEIFREFQPAVVLHAAAHKHVPLMEQNPVEAIKNNVFGTELIARLAGESGAQAFVLISTDKAVNPTSVMGASKRTAEIVVQSLRQQFPKTRYMAVRFGNVLGSAGSVVPIFREQICKSEPITVTHPDMTRYFMTIPEAAQLVLQAGAIGAGGEIFILDMGEPVRIVQLAEDLIKLSGLQPYDDIDIVFTGVRAGEKLFEELEISGESLERTAHRKIFIGKIQEFSPSQVKAMLDNFAHAINFPNAAHEMRQLLNEFLPEANLETADQTHANFVANQKKLNQTVLRDDDTAAGALV